MGYSDESRDSVIGSVLILILTGFVLACVHFNTKETARLNAVAVEDDATRVQAKVTAVQTVYWTKEKVEGLTVWYGDESYRPKGTSLSKDKVIVHRGRHRSGYGFYRKSDGSLGLGWVSGTGYSTYISPDGEIGAGWTVSSTGRTPDREEKVTLTRYFYNWNVPVTAYANAGGSLLNPDGRAVCGITPSAGNTGRVTVEVKYDVNKRVYTLEAGASEIDLFSDYRECGISKFTVKLSNLQVGTTYIFAGTKFVADSSEKECSLAVPNSGLIGDDGQSYYSDSLQSVDAAGNLTTEFIFKVKGASVDW